MRLLANENVPGDAVTALRNAGHDVAWVRTDAPGIPDGEVLSWAVREKRILLTFDKDFGELAWRADLPHECGIVLFRIGMPPAGTAGAIIASVLERRDDWMGHFTVVERGRIRMRPLP